MVRLAPARSLAFLLALLILLPLAPAPAGAAPNVRASTWIILDDQDGAVLAGADPHRRTATASLTKVMTGLLAVERGSLDQRVKIVQSDLIGESTAELVLDEDVSLRTLLYGLLMRSGNDAAMAIARAVGGSPQADDPSARERFVGWMNERAATLGLTDTHFVNPHGLDEANHFSTVYDLALITRAAIRNPTFVAAFGARTFSGDGHEYVHANKLPDTYPGVLGGKTGWTDDAGLCLIEVASRSGRRLIVVLIDSTFERWYPDAADLLDFGWTIPVPATSPARATAVFNRWHDQLDKPVAGGLVKRSWVWGLPLGDPVYAPYVGASGDQRIVQYYDKGRMEVNDPFASPDSPWYVTGGRLAWEMITGQRQIGDDSFEPRSAARIPLAGDPSGDSPSYGAVRGLLSASPIPAGWLATYRLSADGRVTDDRQTAGYGVTVSGPVRETNHSVASVFQSFLGQTGPVYVDGRTVDGALFAPAFAVTGLPITEPYWVRVPLNGASQDVLVQCFERRSLTYAPNNAPEWQVEMGNTGQHYLRWLTESQIIVPQDGWRDW
jgi:D-alanyl-D-alanine carboxypeptidase